MPMESKIELIKKLENMVSFQKDCLDSGDWNDFDKIENEIEELESKIVNFGQ